MANMEAAVAQQLLKAAEKVEETLDAEMKRLDNMDEDGIEELRRKRLDQLKNSRDQREKYLAAGHGEYTELQDEKAFFEACKKSERLVCHFFLGSSPRCEIVDKHLRLLARKHLETRFVCAKADKFPFLTGRLNIRIIPTLALVKSEVTVDYIRGFDDVGGVDDFTTEQLEWRIAQNGLLNYDGDLTTFPAKADKKKPKPKGAGVLVGKQQHRRNIRQQDTDSSDEDE